MPVMKVGSDDHVALQDELRRYKNARQRVEPDWYMNTAYYQGAQWVFWNRGRLDQPRLEPWRVKVVDNRILPAVNSRVARKTKNRPTFVATPTSYDYSDFETAELSEQILENDWIALNLQEKLHHALTWSEVVCAGFLKVYWDAKKGESTEYLVGPDGQPITDPQGNPIQAGQMPELEQMEGISKKMIAEGGIQVDVCSPFELYVDPLAHELEECEKIFQEKVRSTEYVKKHYDKEVQPDTDAPIGVTEARLFPLGVGQTNAEYRGVTIYECWERPNTKNPKGRCVTFTKSEILKDYDLDEAPFDGCPYVMFSGIKVPGRFWPTCVVTQMRGPQTDLNKIESQIRESAMRIGNPALLTSRQANIVYEGLPGERIEFDSTVPDAVPSYLQPAEMPVYVQNQIDRCVQSLDEISGVHDVSKATVPTGVTAASAINLLQEADDTRLGPEIFDMEYSVGLLGTKILRLRAKFMSDQDLIQVAGEDGSWNIRTYRKTMLADNINVSVQAGSQMPRSKAAKQAAMYEMLQLVLNSGLPVRPRDLRKYLREYGVGGLEHMLAGLESDELQVNEEHNTMLSGQPIDINDWDDDDYHIESHDEFRKTNAYKRQPDMIRMFIDKHVDAHKERRTERINAQLVPPGEQPQNGQPTTQQTQSANQ